MNKFNCSSCVCGGGGFILRHPQRSFVPYHTLQWHNVGYCAKRALNLNLGTQVGTAMHRVHTPAVVITLCMAAGAMMSRFEIHSMIVTSCRTSSIQCPQTSGLLSLQHKLIRVNTTLCTYCAATSGFFLGGGLVIQVWPASMSI